MYAAMVAAMARQTAMFEGAYGPRTRNVTQGHLTGIVAGHYLFPSAAQPRPSGSASVRC